MKIDNPKLLFYDLASLHDCCILDISLDVEKRLISMRIDDIYRSVLPSRNKQPALLAFEEVGRLYIDVDLSEDEMMVSGVNCEREMQGRYLISFDLIYGIPSDEHSRNTKNIFFTFSRLTTTYF